MFRRSRFHRRRKDTGASAEKLLLVMLVFILSYILIAQLTSMFNSRYPSDYSLVDRSYREYVRLDNTVPSHDQQYYIEREWSFVPGIPAAAIESGEIAYEDLEDYSHYTDITISRSNGWDDLGNPVWHMGKSYAAPSNGYTYGIYYLTIKPIAGSTLYLSVPYIHGSATVFCNGNEIGKLGDAETTSVSRITTGYESVGIYPDNTGNAHIIIAVRCDSNIESKGLLGIPGICGEVPNAAQSTAPIMWLAILDTLVILTWVGIIIVAVNFPHLKKYFLLMLFEGLLIAYIMIDCRFIIFTTMVRLFIKFVIRILITLVFDWFMILMYDSRRPGKSWINHHTELIVTFSAAFIMLIPVFYNPTLTSTYTAGIISLVYMFAFMLFPFFEILLFHLNESTSTFTLITNITFLFAFLYMHNYETLRINVPTYTIVIALSAVFLEVFFLINYIRNYHDLRLATVDMKKNIEEKTKHISDMNKDLLETNKRLLENEEARKNVLSNVSHDLRTPITAIRGYAELLMSSGDRMSPEQKNSYLNNILKRSAQMERIVSDIVELTRMESNSNEFQMVEMSMAELLDELYMMYEGDLRGTEKVLKIDLPETDMLMVMADPKKISRVFENLISNAINYTYDEATICIKGWREDGNVHITISDNGIGIPAEEINKIFDRFYRAKNSGKNIKGTGLGLSIVKLIVDHHNADIKVESALGSGTTFHIVMKGI
ncbi:MAG: hypothetical protein J5685_09020 [Clostridiales bacterium]|nr:hypothetical protein [Clostridiales bacterium]